jgi:ribosomal protein S18 acetylase RimI-like enzyme
MPGLVRDRAVARAFFERDRPWWAWALCSLGEREDGWRSVRFHLDERSGAAIWVYDHPWWGGAVHTHGSGAALEALVRAASLPRRAFVRLAQEAHDALNTRYRLERPESIVRMFVTPAELAAPAEALEAEPLGLEHGPELLRLYAGWPESRFQLGRLRRGYRYQGIHRGGRLVAVAENALRSAEEGIAIVQGVYVDPDWRGRGLAGAVTAALTRQLFEAGARDVVLDVRAENAPAIAAYTRLGYRRWGSFLGQLAELR